MMIFREGVFHVYIKFVVIIFSPSSYALYYYNTETKLALTFPIFFDPGIHIVAQTRQRLYHK